MKSGRTCARCARRTAQTTYSFYYGKESGFPDVLGTGQAPTGFVHHYQMGGEESVPLCRACVERRHAWTIVKDILSVPLFDLLALAGIVIAAEQIYTGSVLIAAGILAAAAAVVALSYFLNPAKNVGEEMAIDLRKEPLRSQGWTHFWTTDEYGKLQPEVGKFWRARFG